MNPRPEPRIGDAERAAAAAALGEHYAAGRLTREEYDERSELVWAAKTNAHLYPLFVDLPALGAPAPTAVFAPNHPSPRPSLRTQPHVGRNRSGFRFPWLPVILLVIGLSILLPGPWWLLLVGALVFSKTRHGSCHRDPRGSWTPRGT